MTPLRFAFFTTALALVFLLMGCGSDAPPAEDTASEAPTQMAPAGPSTGLQASTEPEPAPDLALQTMDGETLNLAKRPGEVLIVNFWATWCPPCREEIPDLVDLQAELGERGLTVVGVALDEEGEDVVRPFLEEFKVNYPIVLDTTTTVSQEFGDVMGLPTTFVIGPGSQIRRRILGLFPVDDLKPTLIKMLDEGAPTS